MEFYGHFYNLEDTERPYCGRSTLEIVRPGVVGHSNVNSLLSRVPDFLVIMMNPGSSKPRDPDHVHNVQTTRGFSQEAPLVRTVPDLTQRSIVQLMAHKELDHARVLKLSDIRQPRSPTFLRGVTQDNPNIPAHSIFSEQRIEERKQRLQAVRALVILAWGPDTRLRFLAQSGVDALPGSFRRLGVRKHEHYHLYAHPWPRTALGREDWIHSILEQWPD